jgi:glycosyltransferase involved in cell wall biosynthesis
MRILLVNHEYTLTGASLVLLRLADHLLRAGHSLTVFGIVPAPGPIRDAYEARGVPICETVTVTDYDVGLFNTICAADSLRRVAAAIKTVWLIHETDIGLRVLLEQPGRHLAFDEATAVVYEAAIQRDVVFRSFTYRLDPKKFHVIPPTVNIGTPGRAPREEGRLRIVALGTVDLRKRQGDLVKAVHRLGQPTVECIIIGKVLELEADAAALVAAHPAQFKVMGEVAYEETLAWLNSADAFCLPSASECQPLSILEAAALHKPMILSDLPVYDGIWRHGQNCLMFPVGDVEMLSLQIASLFGAGLRQRLADAAAITARHYYREEESFAKFDALLAHL